MTAGISGIPWGQLGIRAGGEDALFRARSAGTPGTACARLPGMPDALALRLVILGAIALLGGVVALAIVEERSQDDRPAALVGAAAPAGWNTAFAGPRGPAGDAQRTTCGQVLAPDSLGVTHPVLPCGTKLILRNGERQVLSEVIDNALVEAGRQLEVTEALGRILDLDRTAEIEWRYATEATD